MKKPSAAILTVLLTLAAAVSLVHAGYGRTAGPKLDSSDEQTKLTSIEQQIIAKESEGLEALKSGDVQRFAALTAADAIFVDAQGPATKAQVVKNVEGFTLSEYSMNDVKFTALSKTSGLVVYKIREKGVSHGKEFTAQVYVSSIWTKRGKDWLCLFSQETAARQ